MHYVTYETLLKTPGESFARIFDFVFGTTTHEKGKSNDGLIMIMNLGGRYSIRQKEKKKEKG